MGRKLTYEELEVKVKALDKKNKKFKEVEKDLKKNIIELNAFINNVPDMAWLKDRKSRFIAANKRFAEAVGMNPESLTNQTCEVCFEKKAAKKFREDDLEVMKGKKQVKIEEKILDYRKNEIWLETIKSPIFDESGKVTGTVGIARDITHRKLAEKNLRDSEENFRTLAENASDGIFIALGDGGYAYANRHASEITGYSISELHKTTIKDLAHPDELDKIKEIHRTIIEGKPFKSNYETMILRKDGTAVPLEVTSARTKWYGQPADIVIIRDISERKRIEEILQESKAMLEAVIESLPFDVFSLDHNNRYILQNSICKKNWGDLIGKSPEDIAVDKHTKDLWIENNRRAFSGETVTDEVVYNRLNGEKSYYFNIITPIRDGDKIFGILGVIIDISEIKKKEEALRVSEKRYRRLVETMNDGIGIQDENGLITYVNNRFCQMLDYKQDDFIGKPVTNFLDDHNRQILKNQTAVRRKGKVKPYEIEWSSKDGRKVQTIMSPQAIFNDEGQFKGSFSVITDISSLKQAERLLRESNERFRNLTEITSDWIWEVDKNGAYTYVSPKIFDILGYREEEVIGKTPFDLMPPAEAERVFKIFDTIRASQQPFDCLENINIHKNGRSVILETSGIPILDADGELCCYRGVDRDITRRKRVEEELRKARDELEIRVEERTRALEIQKSNLEEANIALQVLLDKRQEDKKEAEDNVLTNVKELIAPYFEKIKKTKLDNQQKAFLSIMESNLNEITSPFTRKMSLEYLNLTPTEIHVANLVRYGSNSKEIAELMGLSPRTIYNHRKNIRKKFGLENKKTDLRSYLLSIG